MSYRDCDVSGSIEVIDNYTEDIYQELKYQNLNNNLIITFKCFLRGRRQVCLKYNRIDSLEVVTSDKSSLEKVTSDESSLEKVTSDELKIDHTIIILNNGEKYRSCLPIEDVMQPIDAFFAERLNGSITRSFPWLNLDRIAKEKKQAKENPEQC